MPSWMAWVQRPSGLIKMEGSASALIKVKNVSWKQISIIDLNHYRIVLLKKIFANSYVLTNPLLLDIVLYWQLVRWIKSLKQTAEEII
jgi:hypothetical protein